jgi:RsiW-degrading membrane proteinase PrsW (M82 family)
MMENLAHLNWAAVIVAALVGYFPGALWYSPIGFLKPWARELGVDLSVKPKGVGIKVAVGIVPALVAAIVFAIIAGPHPSLHHGLVTGAEVAIGFVATSFAIQYLYEQRSPAFWLINSGYHLLQYLLMGTVLALWP